MTIKFKKSEFAIVRKAPPLLLFLLGAWGSSELLKVLGHSAGDDPLLLVFTLAPTMIGFTGLFWSTATNLSAVFIIFFGALALLPLNLVFHLGGIPIGNTAIEISRLNSFQLIGFIVIAVALSMGSLFFDSKTMKTAETTEQ
ncbi:MAG: hypothetical protein AAFQ24_13510 [Pseudomonadota bacterium]